MPELKPKQILREISRRLPDVWNQVKRFRADKGKTLPDWPDWCYLPLAAGYAISTQGGSLNANLFDSILSPAVITAAASWRVSQGVYRFDADLYNSLFDQPLDGKIPCNVLKRLPEWCVYIETTKVKFSGKSVIGFWAHMENDMNDGRMELRMVLICAEGDIIPIPIHLGNWTIEDGLSRMLEQSNRQTNIYANPVLPNINFTSEIVPLVQLVLYLCADNIDIPVPPKHPSARIRMSGQVDVPKETRVWTVGERIGSSIRKYRNQNTEQSEPSQTEAHASPRPHIRRAHWHHFWVGPKNNDRKLVLHWLPPIPVRMDEEYEGPSVIHKVKQGE